MLDVVKNSNHQKKTFVICFSEVTVPPTLVFSRGRGFLEPTDNLLCYMIDAIYID